MNSVPSPSDVSVEPGSTPVLQRKPLGSQIATALRRDILFGRLTPGTRLSQQELCERFGTSRMPVRDALRELVYSGLLEQDGGRHAIVASLNRSDLLDSFTIEGMLSAMAARKATINATQEDLDQLESMHERMCAAHAAGESRTMANLNWDFHRYINKLSRSKKLLSAIQTVSLEVPRDYLIEFPQWAAKSNIEHGQIIDAMKKRDVEKVDRLMLDHLVESGVGLTDYLEREGLRLD